MKADSKNFKDLRASTGTPSTARSPFLSYYHRATIKKQILLSFITRGNNMAAQTTTMTVQRPPSAPRSATIVTKPTMQTLFGGMPLSESPSRNSRLLQKQRHSLSVPPPPRTINVDTTPTLTRRRSSGNPESQSKHERRSARRVCFELEDDYKSCEDDGEAENETICGTVMQDAAVKLHIHNYPAVPREFYGDVYWSKEETISMKKHQKTLAKKYVKIHPELLDSIYLLHGYSVQKTEQGTKVAVSTNSRSIVSSSEPPSESLMSQEITEEIAQRILAESDSRGLEPFMTPLITKHRLWAVRKLLSLQERCVRNQLNQQQEEDQEEVISPLLLLEGRSALHNRKNYIDEREQLEILMRVWSLRVGTGPSSYAHHVAKGDEAEARKEYLRADHSLLSCSVSKHSKRCGKDAQAAMAA